MALTVLFLLTSIVTAWLLDKKKMHAASVAYWVMFAIVTVVLLFVMDVEPIRDLMVRLVGKKTYVDVHYAFRETIQSAYYGIYVIGALAVTFVLQLLVTIFCATKAIVVFCFSKKSFFEKNKKTALRRVVATHSRYLYQDINLLYCRMLN